MTKDELDYMELDAKRDIESRGGAYIPHACSHVIQLVAEVRRLQEEIARVMPFLAMHGACGYSFGPFVPTLLELASSTKTE